jgi:hypothetical protein
MMHLAHRPGCAGARAAAYGCPGGVAGRWRMCWHRSSRSPGGLEHAGRQVATGKRGGAGRTLGLLFPGTKSDKLAAW